MSTQKRRSLQTAATASLCLLLAGQSLLSAAEPQPAPGTRLTAHQRTLHALDRLTFGPRPGDVATVERMGLNRWFEQQLNPASIDDAALDQRLSQYPAMQLSLAEMHRRYPSPGELRQMQNGVLALPSDPADRALTADQLAFYAMRGKQQEKNAAAALVAASELAPEPPAPDAPRMTPEQVQQLLTQPPDQRMAAVLAMPPTALVQFRNGLGPQQLARLVNGMTPQQKETLTALPGSLRVIGLEAMESRLDRDLYSERQLEAVMTDFWLNHFNVYVRKNQNEPYLLGTYERETIRPHALGRFEDLLVATAEAPAMLEYLDNFRSIGPASPAALRADRLEALRPDGKPAKAAAGLNENYGRELMELHTLGVNGGYTQADVTSVSKVFTGWGLDRPGQGGGFVFEPRRHEPGAKTVLGQTIPAGGMDEGLRVLHMLATSPATAHFISEKLAVRFVSDTPPPALVNKMAATFLKSDGDIKAVLRTMFYAPEFWSPAVYRAKVKTPLEFVVSAARASDLQVTSTQALVQSLDKLGMPLYGMQTPQGYSWKQEQWVSTGALVSRMNFSLVLTGDRLAGTSTAWPALLDKPRQPLQPAAYSDPMAAKEQRLEAVLLGEPASARTRAAVLAQSANVNVTEQAATDFDLRAAGKGDYAGRGLNRLKNNQLPDDPQAAVMAGLLLGSPEFQRR